MKKFEEVLKQKAHLNKIKNAKKTVPQTAKYSTSKMVYSKVNDQAQLLIRLYENKSYDSIPAYKLLRTANLQQYTKGFILRGYGINLSKLAYLTEQQKTKLFEDLKVLPGHTVKLQKIIKAVARQSYQDVFETSQVSQVDSVAKQSQKEKTAYSNMTKKRTIQEDIEYAKQLQRVFNEYTPPMNDLKNKSSKTQKRSSMLSTVQDSKYNKTKYLPPKPISKGSQVQSTNVDFRKKASEVSTKPTIRKTTSIVNSQKQIKPCPKKQESSRETLNRLLQGVAVGSVIESKKVMEIDLQLNKIKDLYKSFDGAVMSSTIANLDIQELIYAFAGHVSYKVVPAPEPEKKKTNDMYGLDLQNLKFQVNEQDSLDNQQPIEDQIGQILRESYMHPLYRQAGVTENIECDEVNSEGSNEQEDQNTGNEFANNHSGENNMIESSFLSGQSFHFGLDKPLYIFNQPQPTDIDYFKPTVDSIFNFIKNIVLSAKMEREIPVMASTYLDIFLEKSKTPLTSINYKRLLVTCLLLASKVWDDESFETPSFSKTFPEYSTILLNEMEKQLLKFLDYKLKIDKRQYALTYFKLRKFIKKNIKSYQNRKIAKWVKKLVSNNVFNKKEFFLRKCRMETSRKEISSNWNLQYFLNFIV